MFISLLVISMMIMIKTAIFINDRERESYIVYCVCVLMWSRQALFFWAGKLHLWSLSSFVCIIYGQSFLVELSVLFTDRFLGLVYFSKLYCTDWFLWLYERVVMRLIKDFIDTLLVDANSPQKWIHTARDIKEGSVMYQAKVFFINF